MNKEELKREIQWWLPNRVWIEDEIHPFGDLNPIGTEFKEIIQKYGVGFEGMDTKEDTLIFKCDNGLQIHIQPTIQRDGFKVVFRWELDTNPNNTGNIDSPTKN